MRNQRSAAASAATATSGHQPRAHARGQMLTAMLIFEGRMPLRVQIVTAEREVLAEDAVDMVVAPGAEGVVGHPAAPRAAADHAAAGRRAHQEGRHRRGHVRRRRVPAGRARPGADPGRHRRARRRSRRSARRRGAAAAPSETLAESVSSGQRLQAEAARFDAASRGSAHSRSRAAAAAPSAIGRPRPDRAVTPGCPRPNAAHRSCTLPPFQRGVFQVHRHRPGHGQRARLRQGPRHRAQRAIGRCLLGVRQPRRGRRLACAPDARPHAGPHHRQPPDARRRHRRLPGHRGDAALLHRQSRRQVLAVPAGRHGVHPGGRHQRRESRRCSTPRFRRAPKRPT